LYSASLPSRGVSSRLRRSRTWSGSGGASQGGDGDLGARARAGHCAEGSWIESREKAQAAGDEGGGIALFSACPQALTDTLPDCNGQAGRSALLREPVKFLATGCETVSSWGTLEALVFTEVVDIATSSRDPRDARRSWKLRNLLKVHAAKSIFHLQGRKDRPHRRHIRIDGESRLDRTCLTWPRARTSIPSGPAPSSSTEGPYAGERSWAIFQAPRWTG
jgi:hypothetical protein